MRADVPPRHEQRDRARKRDCQQLQTNEMAAVAQAIRHTGERAHGEKETAEDEHGPVGRAPSGKRQQRRDNPGAVKNRYAPQRGGAERHGLHRPAASDVIVEIREALDRDKDCGTGRRNKPRECELNWFLCDHINTPIRICSIGQLSTALSKGHAIMIAACPFCLKAIGQLKNGVIAQLCHYMF